LSNFVRQLLESRKVREPDAMRRASFNEAGVLEVHKSATEPVEIEPEVPGDCPAVERVSNHAGIVTFHLIALG
jgi:hypothetical protein